MSYRPHRRPAGFPWLTVVIILLIALLLAAAVFIICNLDKIFPDFSSSSGSTTEPPSTEVIGPGGPGETDPSGQVSESPSLPLPGGSEDPDPSHSPDNTEPPPVQKETEIPWNLVLVNGKRPMPEGYKPQLAQLPNGLEFDARAISALKEMLAACKAEGLSPVACSAYRTVEYQTGLFERKINSYLADGLSYDEAYAAAAMVVAIPGTSEHNMGLAVDICALSYQILDEEQEKTPEQQWLMAHCHEYGFILRYPNNKSDITGIIYEPWHYRYVGVEAATEIMTSGMCLEEYMEQYYVLPEISE